LKKFPINSTSRTDEDEPNNPIEVGSCQQLIPKVSEFVFIEGLGKEIRKLVIRWAVNKLHFAVNNQLL